MNYKESIKAITEAIKVKYKPEKIILFGSCAYGKIHNDSDIDMLIVKNTEKSYGERWLEVNRLVRSIEKPLPFEPFVLTPDEVKREVTRNLFLQEVLGKGKVLYEKN